MKQDGTMALFQYWNRLRDGRIAPKRTEIEPSDIKSLLADTFILEKDVRGHAVFRLAGTRLCAVYGRELKGFSFASLWLEKDRKLIARLADGGFRSQIAVVSFEGISAGGRGNLFELIILPLDGGQEHPRALGSVVADEKPLWLGVEPVFESRIQSVRVVDPEREPLFLKNRPAVAVPPPLAPRLGNLSKTFPEPVNGRKIRHLVVYQGGREEAG